MVQTNPLFKSAESYNLYIPDSVEKKIRTLLTEIHNIEWSGVLFYTFNGSFETKDIEIHCVDLLPLNIGNASFTEFTMSPEVISYMAKNDLLDCQMGLVH